MTAVRKTWNVGLDWRRERQSCSRQPYRAKASKGSKPDKQSERGRSNLQQNRHNPKTRVKQQNIRRKARTRPNNTQWTDGQREAAFYWQGLCSYFLSFHIATDKFWYSGASYCTVCDFVFTNKVELNLDLLATVCSYYLHKQQFITLQDVAY